MNITWKNCIKVGVSAFLLFICIYYWSAVSEFLITVVGAAAPIGVGLTIAYVLNILMSFYERHYFRKMRGKRFVEKTRRGVCLVGAILTLVLIVALIIWLVVPELASCVRFLVAEIPPLIEKVVESEWVGKLLPESVSAELQSIDWMSYVTKLVSTFASGLGNAVNVVFSAISSIVSVIVTVFISIIFSIYLLYGKDKLQKNGIRMMNAYLPKKVTERIMHCLTVVNDCFHRYIVGQCAEAVILGLLCMIGMMIFRFPYAAMIGTLVGFTALIPVAGAYIGAVVGALMILTESPLKALLFIIFILVLQQLEGNFIYPKVVGKSIGLPAIWVLAAVTVGGSLFGILGMLVGVPIVAAGYRLVNENIDKRELLNKKR